MRRVLPVFDVRGLRVRFGRTPVGDVALALHEPVRRTLFLPPETASGTLAHELAHDLDWSSLERGSYSTDQSIRRGAQRLAAVLGRFAGDSLTSPGPENRYHVDAAHRPAEVFARGFDWFVAASLADQGRSNGHLSAVQDEVLAGRVGAVAPRRGTAATALVDLIEQMTQIAAPARHAFLERYAGGRSLTAWEAVRGVLDVDAPEPGDVDVAMRSPLPFTEGPGGDSEASFAGGWCAAAEAREPPGGRWVWIAARAAADARARGVVARWATRPVRADSPAWRRALGGAPWDPELRTRVTERVCDVMLGRWAASAAPQLFAADDGAAAARPAATRAQ
jgi:hypothetical protein